MIHKHFILTLLALLVSITTSAYEWTDENGTVWKFTTSGNKAILGINGNRCISGTIPQNLSIPFQVYADGHPAIVTSIGDLAFWGYTTLTSITIPETVTSIGEYAFENCRSLTSLISKIQEPFAFGLSAFKNISSRCVLTVPTGTRDAYIAAGWTEDVFKGGIVENIPFDDANIKALCVANWDTNGDGELSMAEAAAITDLGTVFKRTTITSFNELKYFTGLNTIDIRAFENCLSLRFVTIPESVTSIGGLAFYGCSSLTSVTIPNSITSIGNMAFYGCSNLTSITIPNSVTSINSCTFYGCSSLISITIPSGVTSIGESAFQYCSGLTSVTIPNSVTSIGHSAFSGCTGLNSITIPNGVTSIKEYAFSGCSSLTSINIPNSMTSIGGSAFYGCSGLTSVVSKIQEPFAYVFSAFDYISPDCVLTVPSGTRNAYIAAGWTEDIFKGGIIEDEDVGYRYYNLVITGVQGGEHIQFSEFDLLDESLGEVAAMNAYAGTEGFDNESWPNVTDNDVHTKYCGNFSGNTYFLFDAMSEIEPYGYRFYTASDTPRFPERNPSTWELYGSHTKLTDPNDPGWEFIDQRIYDMTLQATSYVPYDFYIKDVPNKLTLNKQSITLLPNDKLQLQVRDRFNTIEDLTLQWTSSNTSVATVNNQGLVVANGLGSANITVTAVEDNTLKATCTVSVVADLPGHRYYQFAVEATAGNTQIQLSEFDLLDQNGIEITPLSTYAYTGSAYSDNETQEKLFDDDLYTKYCGPFSSSTTVYIYIDAGKKVSLSGYRMTTAVDTREYPERNPVTWSLLGSNTQSNQPNAAVWTLLDHHENDYTLGAQIWTPYDFFFTYPDESSNISFADNIVKAICVANWDTNGDGGLSMEEAATVTDLGIVFKENTNITSFNELSYFTGLTSIGDYAFYGCSSMTNINIPNSVTSIGDFAFYGCSSLTNINIPNSVTSIGDFTFADCTSLTNINIPNSVTSIGDSAFTICTSLTNINIPNSVTSISDYAFCGCTSLTNINIPNSVTSISDYAFCDCTSLTNINIPNSVTSIGDFAFTNCTSLTNINIPNSVTSIGNRAFFGCSSLTNINIPNSVTSIGEYAFYGCSSLTNINIPNSVTSIWRYAFYGCSSLTNINIPEGVTRINNSAFADCTSLTDVWCYAENVPITESDVFRNSPIGSATLHVPRTSLNAYRGWEPWSGFGTIVPINGYVINDETTSFSIASEESGMTVEFTHAFNGEWEALYLPFAVDYDAIKADFDLAEIDEVVQNDNNNDGVADMTVLSIMGFKEQMTTPNKPYLIRAKNAGEQTIVFDDVIVYPTTIESIDCSSTSVRYDFTGSYNTLNASTLANRYIVQNGELVKGASSLAPCRWYMTATARNGAPLNLPNKIRIMSVEDVITGVEDLNANVNLNDSLFDLQGRKVTNPRKGIYIQNGKKVALK